MNRHCVLSCETAHMKKTHLFIMFCLSLTMPTMLVQGEAKALDLYVSPAGSDTNDGRDAAKALATLQRAHLVARRLLSSSPAPLTIKVMPGVYKGQYVRWSFSMPTQTIRIVGIGGRPVFDGGGPKAGRTSQLEFMAIARESNTSENQPSNIIVENLEVRNYLEGIIIRGEAPGTGGYLISEGRNRISNVNFINIGKPFAPRSVNTTGRASFGAVMIKGSRNNVVENSRFENITNDEDFPSSYATYGGLHAIYIMQYSAGTVVRKNVFSKIFARGVVKFRNFSNFGVVEGNIFSDDTSIVMDDFCDQKLAVCKALAWVGCPSWGIQFRNNRIGRYRPATTHRPTVDFRDSKTNQAYCSSERFWTDTGLDKSNPLYQVAGKPRLIQSKNVIGR
jgi:hypothetical protein